MPSTVLPETQHARRLVRHVHFHKQRGLTPLKRRYLLADIRAMTHILKGKIMNHNLDEIHTALDSATADLALKPPHHPRG